MDSFLTAGRKMITQCQSGPSKSSAMYPLLSGSSSAYKITTWTDLHFLSTIRIVFCACMCLCLCLCPGDYLMQTLHLPVFSQILTPFYLGSLLIVFVPGWRLFISPVLMWTVVQWVSELSNKGYFACIQLMSWVFLLQTDICRNMEAKSCSKK